MAPPFDIAVIPARGGSKRIPRKNIKDFAGKPMLAYAIEAAQLSGCFTRIIVSTDDAEIARVAYDLGAEVPFVRPPDLADDHTPTVPVIAHALRACTQQGDSSVRRACCIYPGVPFLVASDIQAAANLLGDEPNTYVFPVCDYPSPIQRALRLVGGGRLSAMHPQYTQTRTQDLEPAVHDAGQFYYGSVDAWLRGLNLHAHGVGLHIPHWRVVDIDTPEDWKRAELLHAALVRDLAGADSIGR
ncbi:MAG: pseudaminic acid cytidylyltransferase [Burkholderiales bacterium]|nr:pseudaminic acid cytidylyltransferase [Burkholderiales bacterium]